MGDSSLSATELRKRYLPGGSLSDDQLTAPQLRARAGIPSNARNFSTKDNDTGGSPMQGLLILTIAVGAIAAVVYLIWGAGGGKK